MDELKENPQIEMIIDSVINTYADEYKNALKNPAAVQHLTNLCVQFSGRKQSPLTFSLALQRRLEKDRQDGN